MTKTRKELDRSSFIPPVPPIESNITDPIEDVVDQLPLSAHVSLTPVSDYTNQCTIDIKECTAFRRHVLLQINGCRRTYTGMDISRVRMPKVI